MRVKAYKYSDPKTQTVYFRGYVEYVDGMCIVRESCPDVWKTRGEAERDAEKLRKKMKHGSKETS